MQEAPADRFQPSEAKFRTRDLKDHDREGGKKQKQSCN